MDTLKENLEKLKFDKRLYNFNVQMGVVKPEEYEQYRSQLPDESDKATHFGDEFKNLEEDSSSNQEESPQN